MSKLTAHGDPYKRASCIRTASAVHSMANTLLIRIISTMLHRLVRTQSRRLHVSAFDAETISVSGLDSGPDVSFRNIFLRDSCQCPESVGVSTQQKTFSTGHIAKDIAAVEAKIVDHSDEPELEVQWNDGHSSRFSKSFLQRYANQSNARDYRRVSNLNWRQWTKESAVFKHMPSVDYHDYMNSHQGFAKALSSLHHDGIVIVRNIPLSTDQIMVEVLANKIGYIKSTFYGQSWDVVSVPLAKNVAYTSVYLPLHMDLLYYESPPGVQLLHVLLNSTRGGESVFADSYAAALHIKATDVEAYDALTKVPIAYHYVNDNHHYYYSRPLVDEDINSPVDGFGKRDIKAVNYSPPFQGPLETIATPSGKVSNTTLKAFLRGLALFETYIEDPQNQVELRMEENSCVLFMNRRILHGRRAFDQASGKRHFKGTYLDTDAFYSKVRTVLQP